MKNKNEYTNRKELFAFAKVCQELGYSDPKIEYLAWQLKFNRIELVQAVYILNTRSNILQELVVLGFWSVAEAKNRAYKFFRKRRLRQDISTDQTSRFEKELQYDLLLEPLPGEYIIRLIRFFNEQMNYVDHKIDHTLIALCEDLKEEEFTM